MHNTPPLLSAFPPSLLFFNSFHPSPIFSLTYHLSCLTVISLSVFSLLSSHILLFCHSTFSSLFVAPSVFSFFLPSSSLFLLSRSFRFTFSPSSFHFSFFLWGVIIWSILCVFDFSSAQEACLLTVTGRSWVRVCLLTLWMFVVLTASLWLSVLHEALQASSTSLLRLTTASVSHLGARSHQLPPHFQRQCSVTIEWKHGSHFVSHVYSPSPSLPAGYEVVRLEFASSDIRWLVEVISWDVPTSVQTVMKPAHN